MKFDLDEFGPYTVFKPYQVAVWEYLIRSREGTSRQVWNYVKVETPISRSSVIVFLNKMVGEGLLNYRTTSGKGGHYPNYVCPHESSEELYKVLAQRIMLHVHTQLCNVSELEGLE